MAKPKETPEKREPIVVDDEDAGAMEAARCLADVSAGAPEPELARDCGHLWPRRLGTATSPTT